MPKELEERADRLTHSLCLFICLRLCLQKRDNISLSERIDRPSAYPVKAYSSKVVSVFTGLFNYQDCQF